MRGNRHGVLTPHSTVPDVNNGVRHAGSGVTLAKMSSRPELTPELVVRAYCQGFFPMARHRHGQIDWYCPDPRSILPLDDFHIPRNLRKRVRRGDYLITTNRAFEQVIHACSEPRSYQRQTWINNDIIDVYTQLNRIGVTHSLEAWRHKDGPEKTQELVRLLERGQPADAAPPGVTRMSPEAAEEIGAPGDAWELVGGLYGVSLGGAFFGESMFTRATDASKVCLVYLVEHLRQRNFVLLDTQIANPHTQQFGAIEISQEAYGEMLDQALQSDARF